MDNDDPFLLHKLHKYYNDEILKLKLIYCNNFLNIVKIKLLGGFQSLLQLIHPSYFLAIGSTTVISTGGILFYKNDKKIITIEYILYKITLLTALFLIVMDL